MSERKSSRPTTVLVAQDHPLMLEAMIRHLDAQPDISVVAAASDGPQLVGEFERHRPDVVLTDYWLPGYTGGRATRRIRAIDPDARVIFFSGAEDPRVAAACLEAGGLVFVSKTSDGDELLTQIRAAVTCAEPRVDTPATVQSMQPASSPFLTKREREVLKLLADGHSNRSIGRQLFLSPETVKTHVRGIYKKLGIGDRASAVRVALRNGLVEQRRKPE